MPQATTEGARQRKTAVPVQPSGEQPDMSPGGVAQGRAGHPAGPVKHGGPMQVLRIVLFVLFFLTSSVL